MNLSTIANARCLYCNGSGVNQGGPCQACTALFLEPHAYWRPDTRHGMRYDDGSAQQWGAPVDHAAEADRQRYSGDVRRHGYGRW